MAYREYKQLEDAQRSELNRALYTANPLDKNALAIERSQLINSAYGLTPDVAFQTIMRETEPIRRDLETARTYLIFVGAGEVRIGQDKLADAGGKLYTIHGEESFYIFPGSCIFFAQLPHSHEGAVSGRAGEHLLPVLPQTTPSIKIMAQISHGGDVEYLGIEECFKNFPSQMRHEWTRYSLSMERRLSPQLSEMMKVRQFMRTAITKWNGAPLPQTALEVISDCETRLDEYDVDSLERRFQEVLRFKGPLILAVYMRYVWPLPPPPKIYTEYLTGLSNNQIESILISILEEEDLVSIIQKFLEDMHPPESSWEQDGGREPARLHVRRQLPKQQKIRKMMDKEQMEATTLQRWLPLSTAEEGNCCRPRM